MEEHTLVSDDGIHKPNRRSLLDVFIPINLLLTKCPIGKRLGMRPQRNSCGYVNETNMARLRLPGLGIHAINNTDFEKSFVITAMLILRNGCELLVSWHQRRRNVMCQKMGLGIDVEKLYNVVVTNNASVARFWQGLSWNDLPMIIGVIMRITSDLLTYTSYKRCEQCGSLKPQLP